MNKNWHHITLSIVGISHAISQIDQLAKTGFLNTQDFEYSVSGLLNQQPESVEQVYTPIENLHKGAQLLKALLADKRDINHQDCMSYLLSLLHIQKKLMKHSDFLYSIGTRLEGIDRQLEHFDKNHDNITANIANIYTDTVSTFKHRVQVKGDPGILNQPRVKNQVRTLLLAGIRSATLWRQVGGSRLQFLLNRKHLTQALDELSQQYWR